MKRTAKIRVAEVILSRFRAGESLDALCYDYQYREIEDAFRSVVYKPKVAPRANRRRSKEESK